MLADHPQASMNSTFSLKPFQSLVEASLIRRPQSVQLLLKSSNKNPYYSILYDIQLLKQVNINTCFANIKIVKAFILGFSLSIFNFSRDFNE